ncbi:MAG: hypothetical protein ACKN9W_17510 [Methylococcus sp.]
MIPGFAVNLSEQIEGIQAEVHGPAGRVQQLEGAWVTESSGQLSVVSGRTLFADHWPLTTVH